jgi:hypothetical protein
VSRLAAGASARVTGAGWVVEFDEGARDLGYWCVRVFGQLDQQVERSGGVDGVALLQDAFGLADDIAGGQCASELLVFGGAIADNAASRSVISSTR